MQKIFWIILIFVLFLQAESSFAAASNVLKQPMGRFGVKETTFEPYFTKEEVNNIISQEKKQQKRIFDKENRAIAVEIEKELEKQRPEVLADLNILWVNAVERSETIRYAIMKLSNPNGEEVKKSGIKKVLAPIAGVMPMVGQAAMNPALSASSIIGGGLLGTVLSDDINAKLSKVNDADLIILAKAVDNLQQDLIYNYFGYINAYREYDYSVKLSDKAQKKYEEMNRKNSSNIELADSFYREALDNQYKLRQEFLMKRVVLEQMVGNEALLEVEKRL
ncbi:MAG: hypothetical protein PHX18_01645 [Candidatus Gastranaerophilales bacterium]|nr:hypothetical protein [Candidatus Gastranaerophilales bacterium]